MKKQKKGRAANVRLPTDMIEAIESAFGHYASWSRGDNLYKGTRIEIGPEAWADIKAHPLFPRDLVEQK